MKTILLHTVLGFAVFALSFLSIPQNGYAAGIATEVSTSTVRTGERFSVDVLFDAEGESINAIEGRISFPKSSVKFIEVYGQDSVINLWILSPRLDGEGSIVWSGIIPGGFEGVLSPYYEGARSGKLFSLVFEALQPSEPAFSVSNIRALKDDGIGTAAYVHSSGSSLSISGFIAPDNGTSASELKDEIPPSVFTPHIAQDASLFDGAWFLAFTAQDKETGVAGYAVYETKFKRDAVPENKWQNAESPYLLTDQSRKSYIHIRAKDRAGNERIVVLPPSHVYKWYESAVYWGILIVLIAAALYAAKKYVPSSRTSHTDK